MEFEKTYKARVTVTHDAFGELYIKDYKSGYLNLCCIDLAIPFNMSPMSPPTL